MTATGTNRIRSGLSLLELLVVIAVIALLTGLILAGVQRARASAARVMCLNNMRQTVIAVHGYHAIHHIFPPGHTSDDPKNKYPYLGWQARLLPFAEHQQLWTRVEEAYKAVPNGDGWQEPHKSVLANVIPLFGCPADARVGSAQLAYGRLPVGLTSYLGVSGINHARRNGVLYADSAVRIGDITDGTGNTLLVGERPPAADFEFGWWYLGWGQQKDGSADMVLGVEERNVLGGRSACTPGPYHFRPGELSNQCDMFHFWSPHAGGANFGFADGGVRFLRYSAAPVMPALATRAGGEAVEVPD